jgi:[ribosomal protein S5]-alanine N-acetyltransferase
MQIETRRFLIRDLASSDTAAFLAYHADPRSAEFYGPDEAGSEHAHKLLAKFHDWASVTPRQNYQLAVVLRVEPFTLVG